MSQIIDELVIASRPDCDLVNWAANRLWHDGGFTLAIKRGGNEKLSGGWWGRAPLSGYVVGLDKELEQKVELRGYSEFAEIMPDFIMGFISQHCYRPEGCTIGGWREGKTYYLDIVKVVATPAEALALAQANSQLAYYDIEKGDSVYV